MSEVAPRKRSAPLTRRALSLLLPAALNLGMVQLLAPALNAMLARTSTPEPAIGGFAVALGISGLIALPQLRIQHLTLVFFSGARSVSALRRFVAAFALLVTILAALLACTPLSGMVLSGLFATEGALREQAARSLIWLVPFPALALIRMHLYGVALRAERTATVWVGTGLGATAVLIGGLALLTAGVDGAVLGAVSVTAGAGVEVLFLVLATSSIAHVPGGAGARTPAQRTLLRFFTPLLFAAFLPAVTTPLVTAAVARAPEANVSLAALPVAMSIFTLVTLLANGVQPTALTLLARGDDARAIGRFSLLAGLAAGLGALAIAWLPPLTTLVVQDLLGASGRLAELTVVGLRILSFLPPLLALEQLYAAALLETRRPGALVWVNLWRLVGLVAFVVIVPMTSGWSGVAIGTAAISFTLSLEALAAWIYGRRSYRELCERSDRLASDGSG